MKINKLYYLLAVSIVSVSVFALWQIRTNAKSESGTIEMSLITEKKMYSLGEVISCTFGIVNASSEPQAIAIPSIGAGDLKLYLSRDGLNYVKYVGPDWGTLNPGRQQIKLGVGERFEAEGTVLYNRRLPTAHLAPMYAEKVRKERVDTDFAMPEAGHYWLKAAYTNGKATFESDAVEIDVTMPVGSDAVVWEQIRTDGAFAYFLQTGQVKYIPGTLDALAFIEKLRGITTDYPDTNFGERLNEGMVKYTRELENLQKLRK